MTKKDNIIEDFEIDNDIIINHHIASKDTTVFYRFHFFEKEDTLEMRENLPGVKPIQKIDITKVAMGSFNSRTCVPQDINEKYELLFIMTFKRWRKNKTIRWVAKLFLWAFKKRINL